MISTKLSPLDERMPDCARRVDCRPSPSGPAGASFQIAGSNDYSMFPDLERLKNHIDRCNPIGVEDAHTKL